MTPTPRTASTADSRAGLLLVTLLTALAGLVPQAAPAHADHAGGHDYQMVLDVTFPAEPETRFSDTYDACRSGCARYHKAIDIIGAKMSRLFATVDGTICRIDDGAEDSYGRHLTLCGDDGNDYRYLHLNNDNPGTDDGQAGLEHVYAPGIRQGVRVARGQFIAYMGDSGNAEATVDHLHLDIFSDGVTDPYGDNRINPYPSMRAAYDRGDFGDGSIVHTDPAHRIAGSDRVGTATQLALEHHDGAHVEHVVLASAGNPQDAIVAGPLAAELGGPVLVTWDDRLDPRVAEEIRRLSPHGVTIVGRAIGQPVVDALVGLGIPPEDIHRVAGDNRWWTSILVAERVWDLQGAGTSPTPTWTTVDVASHEVALYVSRDRDRTEPARLDGAVLAGGHVAVFADGAGDGVERVSFWIDHPDLGAQPDSSERQWPYDLAGTHRDGDARTFDLGQLAPGEHTVSAVVRWEGGRTEAVHATFEVVGATHRGRDAVVAVGQHPVAGRDWPDSVMASYFGAVTGAPVLLVDATILPDATREALDGTDQVTVIGGPGAVSEEIATTLDAGSTRALRRLAGSTRFSTALAVTDHLRGRGLVSDTHVFAATGHNWPDVVTAGPTAAAQGHALVLVDGAGTGGDRETQDWLRSRADRIAEVTAIGGNGAISPGSLTTTAISIT